MGSGINSTFRQVGIATGTAGLGALFQQLLGDRATGRLAHVPAEVLAQGRPEVAGPGGREAYMTLFTGALNDVFLVGAIIVFAGAALTFALIRQRDFIASGPAVPEQPEAETEAAAA
jgi:hypothetical protein